MSETRSSDSLTIPDAWRNAPRRGGYAAVGFLAVLVIVSLVVAGYAYSVGNTAAGTGTVGFAVLLAVITVIGLDGRVWIRRSTAQPLVRATHDGQTGLVLPYSLIQFAGYMVVMVITGLGLLITGFAVTGPGDSMVNGATVLFTVLALVFWSLPVIALLGRFRRGWVELSPDGIYQRGWSFECYAPWSSIRIIEPILANGPNITALIDGSHPQWHRKYFTRLWRQDRLPKQPVVVIPAKDIGLDIVLVYQLLSYYYVNPASRVELGTSAALNRVNFM